MGNVHFYIPKDVDLARLRDDLRRIALLMGYTNAHGPKVGEGNISALLVAIAKGDLEIRDARAGQDAKPKI